MFKPSSFSKGQIFSSEEGLRQALLKKAEAAPTYPERSQLYERLSTILATPLLRAKVLFFKGVNDFEEGLKCQKQQDLDQAVLQFDRAAQAFCKARELAQRFDPR